MPLDPEVPSSTFTPKQQDALGTHVQNVTTEMVDAAMAAALANGFFIPLGTVITWAGATPVPPRWLQCFGQLLDKVGTYAPLFAAIGSAYDLPGVPAGKFSLPDCRGRAIVGWDAMGGTPSGRITTAYSAQGGMASLAIGGVGGAQDHDLTAGRIPAHTHDVPYRSGGTSGGGSYPAGGAGGTLTDYPTTTSSAGGLPHSNIQPSILMQALIYAGV